MDSQHTLYIDCKQIWRIWIHEAVEQLQVLPNTTSSPSWRPGKRTDYTNLQEAKLKHTIQTDRRKEPSYTQRERERDRSRGWVSWRTKIQIQTSGMKHLQQGEHQSPLLCAAYFFVTTVHDWKPLAQITVCLLCARGCKADLQYGIPSLTWQQQLRSASLERRK